MQRFVDTINWCGLKDLGFIGPKFTSLYQQQNGTQIRERLDRGLATVDWIDRFPSAKLYHHTSSASDYCPLYLQFKEKRKVKRYGKKFKFEAMWLKNSNCEDVVTSAWEEGILIGSDYPIECCLDNYQRKLEVWNRNEFGHMGNNITRF
ncbi:uncharacterized protein LOC142625458 [Castanea sativa]|uniref:uncharacterized protein LOC142625458 n=1 Tax=Castanea sativa TaxID=21020 RepID=UPI003F64D760